MTTDQDDPERQRCISAAIEITKIEQHHGVAEIADVIQRIRAEARLAGRAEVLDSWTAKDKELSEMTAKHEDLAKAALDVVTVLMVDRQCLVLNRLHDALKDGP